MGDEEIHEIHNIDTADTSVEEGSHEKKLEPHTSKDMCDKEITLKPVLQMLFNNEKEVRSFYFDYDREVGFGVTTRRSAMGEDGKLRYFTWHVHDMDKLLVWPKAPFN